MTPQENLDEQIKDIILINGGDIDIEDYPLIIKEAADLGINRGELVRKIARVFNNIEWAPYHRIDKKLEEIILRGSISEKEADEIVEGASNDLQRPKVLNYILASIKKRGFLPREKNSFEHDSFKNRWMTEEAWAKYQRDKIVVEWLKEEAHSLAELGEISFRKPEDAKYYLRNTNYLIPNITTLTKSPSKADEFSKLIEDEPNLDKRFLKVLYRLNPQLPFRLLNQDFATIYLLFDKTESDHNLFVAASESYNNRHIQVWLAETDTVNAQKLSPGWDYNNFLKFLYKINNHHPFYLNALKFDTPKQLLQQATTDASLWNKIAAAAVNQQLPVWLESIDRHDWLKLFNERLSIIDSSGFYTDEERNLAIVQSLIHIINSETPDPQIVSDQQKIQLLAIEGSKPVIHSIHLKLVNAGFTKASIRFDNTIDGISLGRDAFTFWNLNNTTEYTLTIKIDALRLIKNKPYILNILIDSEFQKQVIPVEVKVVFPLKAYLMQLLKYALFGAVFFALVRFITGFITSTESWLNAPESSYYLPQNYFGYVIGLILLLGGLISAFFLIKKYEKL